MAGALGSCACDHSDANSEDATDNKICANFTWKVILSSQTTSEESDENSSFGLDASTARFTAMKLAYLHVQPTTSIPDIHSDLLPPKFPSL